MSNNTNLNKAKEVKNDEFYTFIEDIEKEVLYYKEHFKNKVVYCNCDKYNVSNFVKYFKENFETLGIKKLISTCYNACGCGEYYEYNGSDEIIKELKGNGDFRSEECVEILQTSDIVVTNPPFSLFRDFITLLYENDKSFLSIGCQNSFSCKNVFELYKKNKIWYGKNNVKKFTTQYDGEVKFGNVGWFTNLEPSVTRPKMELTKHYDKNVYRVYDDYNAIECSKLKDIPMDYDGLMGVPISFACKHNVEQFEVIDLLRPTLDKKHIYRRIVIKHRR